MNNEMPKNSIINRKVSLIAVVCLIFVIAFAAVACGTYAWLTRQDDYNVQTPFGNFRAWTEISFDGVDFEVPEEGDLLLGLRTSDTNYWGDLRVNIVVEGLGEIYLRVMVLEIWTETITVGGTETEFILRAPITNFDFGYDAGSGYDFWLDNRRVNPENNNDLFVYYFNHERYSDGPNDLINDPFMISLEPVQGSDDPPRREIPLITYVPTFEVERLDIQLRMRIRVEAVQRNRFREVWGMHELPPPPAP